MQIQSILLFTALLATTACNEKAEQSGDERSKLPVRDSSEEEKPENLDVSDEPATNSVPLVKEPVLDKVGEENNVESPNDLLGQWVLKDSNDKNIITITYKADTFSRQIVTLKEYQFKISSMEAKNGLIYTVHVEPIQNKDTSRYCVHRIVKEGSETYMMTQCEDGAYPEVDWTVFTPDNRYYKVN